MNMTPGIIQALSALRASGCDADADRLESALTKASAVPVRYVRWHPKHGYRWGDTYEEPFDGVPGLGWVSVPLYAHAPPAVPVASVPEGWYVKRDESEIRIGAPDGIPGCMTLTAKERSLPGRILYALALALTTPEPPHAD